MRYAVIMAGGAGVRLWPLSRRDRPKQVLKLLGGNSLLRQSYERIAPLVDPTRIYVIANLTHLATVAEELPGLPHDNLIGEFECSQLCVVSHALPLCMLVTSIAYSLKPFFPARGCAGQHGSLRNCRTRFEPWTGYLNVA